MIKSLFLGARTPPPYLEVSSTTRKETKKSIKLPKSLIPRGWQVEFLHQRQRFIFTTSLTRGLPVHFQGFLEQESQFILRQPVYCWRARTIGKPLITLDKTLKPLKLNPWVRVLPLRATETMSISHSMTIFQILKHQYLWYPPFSILHIYPPALYFIHSFIHSTDFIWKTITCQNLI